MLAESAEDALSAIADPDSATARRVAEMAAFYRFIQNRMPDLLAEWEEIRAKGL